MPAARSQENVKRRSVPSEFHVTKIRGLRWHYVAPLTVLLKRRTPSTEKEGHSVACIYSPDPHHPSPENAQSVPGVERVGGGFAAGVQRILQILNEAFLRKFARFRQALSFGQI